MVLLVLALIGLAALALLVLSLVAGVMLVRRCWGWLAPVCVLGLLTWLTAGVYDRIAAAGPPRAAETYPAIAPTSNDSLPPHEIDMLPAEAPPLPAAVPVGDDAPAWTQRKPGELSAAKANPDVVVHAGPFLSQADCEASLNQQLIEAVNDFIASDIAQQPIKNIPVDLKYIRESLVKSSIYKNVTQRQITAQIDPQEMVDMYALVTFDAKARGDLTELWRASIVHARVAQAGVGLAGILGVLTVAWAMLRRGQGATS